MVEKKTKTYLPILITVRGKKCVVIGGGTVALRKVKFLLDGGAKVTLISPTLHPDFSASFGSKNLRIVQRECRPGDLCGALIVIAATDVKKVNHAVAREARRAGAFVNVVDDSGPSDFIFPSFFRRGDLVIAVSTGGVSPALARKIRTKLEEEMSETYSSLLSLIGEVRSALKRKRISATAEAWQKALDFDSLIPLVKKGDVKRARAMITRQITQP